MKARSSPALTGTQSRRLSIPPCRSPATGFLTARVGTFGQTRWGPIRTICRNRAITSRTPPPLTAREIRMTKNYIHEAQRIARDTAPVLSRYSIDQLEAIIAEWTAELK